MRFLRYNSFFDNLKRRASHVVLLFNGSLNPWAISAIAYERLTPRRFCAILNSERRCEMPILRLHTKNYGGRICH